MTFELHPQLRADSLLLGELPLCSVLLINDSQFPWFVLVPRLSNAKEIYQLAEEDQIQLWQESSLLSQSVMSTFAGDKLNVASIGNLVPQLHIHHVVRFKSDPCWPAPIWGKLPMVSYSLEKARSIQRELLAKIPSIRPEPL